VFHLNGAGLFQNDLPFFLWMGLQAAGGKMKGKRLRQRIAAESVMMGGRKGAAVGAAPDEIGISSVR